MLQPFSILRHMGLTLFMGMAFMVTAQEDLVLIDMSYKIPSVTNLAAEYFVKEGAQKVELAYGPFDAINANINNGMVDYALLNVTRPCSDCLITWMQAGLTYANGTYANANTGIWLHHTVLYNLNRTDPVCGPSIWGAPFFASGNERSAVNICANGTDQVGYYLGKDEELAMAIELMNANTATVPVKVTYTFEYLPVIPASFSTVTPLWLDIGNCSSSEVAVPNEPVFTMTMKPWEIPFGGHITLIGGHVHDGGVSLEITKNQKTICDAVAFYGQTIGYNESSSAMSMQGMDMGSDITHISSITECGNPGSTKVGDEWSLKAHYNFTEHSPMRDSDGSYAPIMGISLVYIVHDDATSNNSPSSMATTTTASENIAVAATVVPSLLVAGGLAAMLC